MPGDTSTGAPRREAAFDGLRAIAILAVVAYHAGVPGATGGFTGVDIFFVLSGYLITGVLLREYRATTGINIAGFYARRARRLVPALVVVLVVTLIMMPLYTVRPAAQHAIGTSVLTSSAFLQNVYFMLRRVDYFQEPAVVNPLTHTWSLSVEEQFYLVWPFLLLGTLRLARAKVRAVLPITIATFSLIALGALVVGQPGPTTVFYSPLARFWELGFGALLATRPTDTACSASPRTLAAAGLAAVVVSTTLIDPNAVLRPWNLLAPTVGSLALIQLIVSAPKSPLVRLLRVYPLTWIGERSYGWYLWHFPAITFVSAIQPDSAVALLIAVLLSLFAAHLSYQLIELPIRRQAVTMVSTNGRTLTTAVLALAVTGGAGYWTRVTLREEIDGGLSTWLEARCPGTTATPGSSGTLCALGADDANGPNMLIWGDSHARVISPLIDSLGRELGFHVTVVWRAGCPPLLGFVVSNETNRDLCRRANDSVIAILAASPPRYDAVALVSNWNTVFGIPPRDSTTLFEYRRRVGEWDAKTMEGLAGAAAVVTVRRLDSIGIRTLVVGQPPQWRHPYSECVHLGVQLCEDADSVSAAANLVPVRALRRAVAQSEHARFLDLRPLFCVAGTCRPERNGRPTFYDHNHLTVFGALTVVGGTRCHFAELAFGYPRVAACSSTRPSPTSKLRPSR